MRILVTGGAGFIGSHICERLLKEGHTVTCVDNFDPYYDPAIKRENIKPFLKKEEFTLVEGDIRDSDLVNKLCRDVDVIFHEAAQAGVRASVDDPIKPYEINIVGLLNLLKAAVDNGVKKLVNASSSSVYGKIEYLPFDEKHPNTPLSPYGVSKLIAENYCRVFSELYGLRTVSLRYFTVYGPRMRPDLAISIFTKNGLRGKDVEIYGDGSKTRDFTYIDDIVDANIMMLEKGDGIFNIGGGNRISMQELAETLIELTGGKSKIVKSEDKRGDVEHTWASVEKAKKELSWAPKVSIDEGLRRFVEYEKGR
jgi:UDP-glucose 4-epimerase